MKKCIILVMLLVFSKNVAQMLPKEVKKLMQSYPGIISDFKNNRLYFNDGSSLVFDDGITKDRQQLLDNPDIQDQFTFEYQKEEGRNDAGRIRNEAFFNKIYGSTKTQVEKKLVEIIWCPKLVNQKIRVTSVNGIDKLVKKLSDELDLHPEFKKYVTNIGGTFNWRKISGTERSSTHSFGMTIDLNTKYSNYWQWDCKCKNENVKLPYKNKFPKKLVALFEKYGFIWGGKWQHYDTMHFEYRPELL